MLSTKRNHHCHLTFIQQRDRSASPSPCLAPVNCKCNALVGIIECLQQGNGKGLDAGKTLVAFLGKCTQDDGIDSGREAPVEFAERFWRYCQVLKHYLFGPSLERELTRQQLVAHDSQSILITSGYYIPAPLFWCHIRAGTTYAFARR